MALVYWGEVDAASDVTMASIVDTPGSRSRSSIIALITPVAAGIIADDPTVIAAAAAAIDAALADTDLLRWSELGAVRTLDVDDELYSEVRLSYDFRRIGGTLRGGGEVGVNPGSSESALAGGNGVVLLTRDYRRARADTANGWPTNGFADSGSDEFTALTGWGDSMTAFRPAVGVAFADELASELEIIGYNCGVPSDTPTQIAWRLGALPVTVNLGSSAGVLPVSGTVPVTVEPQRGWSNAARAWPCVIPDRNGVLVNVVLRQTAASPSAIPTWTLEQSGGTAARTIYSGTRIAHEQTLDREMQQAPAMVWMGRNDLDLTRGEYAIRCILGAVRNPGQRLIVLPVFNQDDEPAGSADYARVMAYNDMLRGIVGDGRWIDARRLLIDHGLEVAGITPTSADLLAISEDRIPASLMADSTHLTAAGVRALARLVANEIKARNW